MTLLPDGQIADGLAKLPDWRRRDQLIEKEFQFPSFADAVVFIVRLGFAAEEADHHPDIAVHYRTVRLSFWTHSEGGITQKDLRGAEVAEGIAQRLVTR